VNAVDQAPLTITVSAFSRRTQPGLPAEPELPERFIHELHVQCRSVLWSYCGLKQSTHSSALRAENKACLMRSLLKRFLRIEHAADLGLTEIPFSCSVLSDRLGRPRLALNHAVELGISFSHCNGTTWAALAGPKSNVGIDAARPGEFEGDYPFHRVFHTGELAPLLKETGDSHREASALVWSAKEAFVKALGCAFHLFSPLEVITTPLVLRSDRGRFLVRLSDRGLERVGRSSHCQMEIDSFRLDGAWVSVAATDCKCICRTSSGFGCLPFYDHSKQ